MSEIPEVPAAATGDRSTQHAVAAGSFLLTVGAFLTIVRLGGDNSPWLLLLLSALFFAPVAYLALTGPGNGVLYFSTIALSTLVVGNLMDALSSGSSIGNGGTTIGIAAVAAFAAYLARSKDSGVSTLLAALAGSAAIFSAINWIFEPSKSAGYRWIALILTFVLLWRGQDVYGSKPKHGIALAEASAVLLAVLAALVATETFSSGVVGLIGDVTGRDTPDGPSGLWSLVIIGGAAALVAFGGRMQATGPQFLALGSVAGFLAIESFSGDLRWWPLILIVLGVGALAKPLSASQQRA